MLVNQYQHCDSIGIDYLWNYFVYQFEYWKKLEIEKRNKKIDISYIVGKKAFDRYISRDTEYDWQITENARTYSKILFEEKVSLPIKVNNNSSYDSDDIYRATSLNTELGLSNCITYTSLFNPKSNNCSQCNFQNQCIQTQQQLYPRIYRNRKIANGSQQTTAGQQ